MTTDPNDLAKELMRVANENGYSITEVSFSRTNFPSDGESNHHYSYEYEVFSDLTTGFYKLHLKRQA